MSGMHIHKNQAVLVLSENVDPMKLRHGKAQWRNLAAVLRKIWLWSPRWLAAEASARNRRRGGADHRLDAPPQYAVCADAVSVGISEGAPP